MSNHNIARRHIEAHARQPGYYEIRILERIPSPDPSKSDLMKPRGSKFIYVNGSIQGVDAVLDWADEQNAKGYEVFIAPNARTTQGGKKEHVQTVTSCYSDFDLKGDKQRKAQALEAAQGAPLPPSLVVDSGYGLHTTWAINPHTDKDLWKRAQQGIRAYFSLFGADQQVATDEARVLRLAPYPNRKYQQVVETAIVFQNDVVYDLEQLAEIYGPHADPKPKKPASTTVDMQQYAALPRRTLEYIAHGASEGQRNAELYAAAQQYHAAGYSQREAERDLSPRAEKDGLSEREALKTIASAYESTRVTEPITFESDTVHVDTTTGEIIQPEATKEASKRKLDAEDAAKLLGFMHRDSLAYDERYTTYRAYGDAAWQLIPADSLQLDDYAIEALTIHGLVRTSKHVNDVQRFARRWLSRSFDRQHALIGFANGTLDVASGTLRPHSHDDLLTYCLPYDWCPEQSTPVIESILASITNDPIARVAIKVHIGLALLRDTTFHQVLLLLGVAGSGKTTLLRLFNLTLGQESNRFAPGGIFSADREGSLQRAECRDWRGVALDEFPTDALRDEEPFKKMTAHSGIDSREHRRAPINAQWLPKIMLASNDIPRFRDTSGALRRRLIIIDCPNILDPSMVDLQIEQKIAGELGGFVAQCLAAALSAVKVGGYPVSRQMQATYDEVATEGDAIKAFVAELCVLTVNTGKDHKVYSAKLYSVYKEWCETNGHKPMSNIALSKRLRSYGPWRISKHDTMKAAELLGIGLYADYGDFDTQYGDFEKNHHGSTSHQEAINRAWHGEYGEYGGFFQVSLLQSKTPDSVQGATPKNTSTHISGENPPYSPYSPCANEDIALGCGETDMVVFPKTTMDSPQNRHVPPTDLSEVDKEHINIIDTKLVQGKFERALDEASMITDVATRNAQWRKIHAAMQRGEATP